jgi:hypothetical protein
MRLLEGYAIQWDLWVQLVGHIAWPIVVLFGVMAFRKPLRELLGRADSVEVAGVKVSSQIRALTAEVNEGLKEAELKLTQSQEDIADAVEIAPVQEAALTVDQEKLDRGWHPVRDAFDTVFNEIAKAKGDEAVPRLARTYCRQHRYVLSSNQMVLEGWFSFELRDTIKALNDVRETVSDQNSRVTEADATQFARSCQKTAGSILNAVRYRLKREPQPANPPSVPFG